MLVALFTIGYEKAPLDAFLATLEANGVRQLLDVRDVAFSRNFRYSKAPLARALEAQGIRYVHLSSLGAPKTLRKELDEHGDVSRFLVAVREVLAGRPEALDEGLALVTAAPTALLCRERDAKECHRSVVAALLAERAKVRPEIVDLAVSV